MKEKWIDLNGIPIGNTRKFLHHLNKVSQGTYSFNIMPANTWTIKGNEKMNLSQYLAGITEERCMSLGFPKQVGRTPKIGLIAFYETRKGDLHIAFYSCPYNKKTQKKVRELFEKHMETTLEDHVDEADD